MSFCKTVSFKRPVRVSRARGVNLFLASCTTKTSWNSSVTGYYVSADVCSPGHRRTFCSTVNSGDYHVRRVQDTRIRTRDVQFDTLSLLLLYEMHSDGSRNEWNVSQTIRSAEPQLVNWLIRITRVRDTSVKT